MPELATLKGYLARAETHITEGELRLARQSVRVERLRGADQDTKRPEALREAMSKALADWRTHRADLLASIARLQAAREP